MKSTISVLLVAGVSLLGCARTTPSGFGTTLSATQKVDGIGYTLSIPDAVFNLSDSLHLTFEVHNESAVAKAFGFANQQQFGFRLTARSGNVALYYPVILQPAGSGFTLRPGETKVFSVSTLFQDHGGNPIKQGEYSLSAYLTEGRSPAVSLQIMVQ